jgi:hypothetical protein
MDFVEMTSTIDYFTILDITSEFGGLYATFKVIEGYLAVPFLVYFMYQLSLHIERTYEVSTKKALIRKIKIN